MCGIHGFNFEDRGLAGKMVAKAAHRGPDDNGISIGSGWSLGHNRLSIIDLSPKGHQPMRSSSGRFEIVFNGEIYNFKELRAELEAMGRKFVSETDTEVILEAYEAWGEKCLPKLNGMFAFAILNLETEEIFIARDRIGIKPLYYCIVGGKLAFSSEVKSLLELGIEREIDLGMFNVYMRVLYIPAPHTIWKNISKLPPAHFLKSQNGKISIERYWNFEDKPLMRDKEEIKKQIKFLIEDSVKRQLVSDRPVGIFLSGGIDSTIVAGVAAKYTKNLNTFSAGYTDTEEGEKYNLDRVLAKKTAELLGAAHHEYIFSAEDIKNALTKSIYHMDEPISNHIQAITMLLAEKTAPIATVVLGGDGGDELFGGYERHYYVHLLEKFKFICPVVGGKRKVWQKMCAPDEEKYLSYFAMKEDLIREILPQGANKPGVLPELFQKLYFSGNEQIDFARKCMRTDVMSWLPNESLARSDKMTMAAGIEERVPLLDHRLVELADRIPTKYKVGSKGLGALKAGHGYKGKQILREAMKEYIPKEVLDAEKWGWFSPASKWIRGPLKEFMKETLSKDYNNGTSELFDFEAINQMFEDHLSKKKYALNTLWAVMTFQIWYRQFMEK